jgi:hypothetical protein
VSQFINLTGVLDDGSGVCTFTNGAIQIPKSADVTIQVSIVTPSGAPVLLGSDGSVVFALSVDVSSMASWPVLRKAGVLQLPPNPPNVFVVTLTPTDTRNLAPGRLWYDGWLTFKGIRYQVLAPNVLHLKPTLNTG